MDDEQQLVEALTQANDIWIEVTGRSHPWLDALIDSRTRRDRATLNYLASTASGTLQDRIFTPSNGDPIGVDQAREINARYRAAMDDALRLAVRLDLPAAAGAERG